MGLRIKPKRFNNKIATAAAVIALVVQPLVALNIPSAFALGSTVTVCASGCDAATIQGGVNMAAAGDTVSVGAGTYIENVTVTKALTVTGAGAATTKIVATNGNATPLTFSTSNATVDGFTITHDYTPAELAAWNFNNNGVFFGQLTSGNTLKNSVVSLSRNGVYINRSSNSLIGNTITNNRTGINATNTIDGTVITGNTISDNWTLGLVYYTATAGLATNFDTVTLTGNTFSNNWYSQIGFKDAPSSTGTLDVTGNTFTDSPVTYATSSDAAWNEPGFAAQRPVALGGSATQPAANYYPTLRIYNSGAVVLKYASKTLRVGTSQPYAAIQAAVNDASDGDIIDVASDLTITNQQTITKAVTINGNGHVLDSSFDNTPNDNANNSAIGVQADDVTINNLVVDGQHGHNQHGVNIFQSHHVVLNDVTAKNNDQSGVNVNGSTVTVNNLTTVNNGWHGVDVDKSGAVLTVNGTSHHSDTIPVYVDDRTIGQVVDTNHQYGSKDNVLRAGDRVYSLKPSVPTLLSPSNNGYTTTNDFYFDWSDVAGAAEYEFQSSQNPAVTNGVLTTGVWNNKVNGGPGRNHLTASEIHSYGASGTWYWQVRAIDANGVTSDWSPVWKMTIDTTAPAAPTNLSWKTSTNVVVANNGATNEANGTAQWQASTSSDVDHYVYKYWNDITDNQYKVGSEYVTTTGATNLPGVFNQGEGVHHFCVAAVDHAGNMSACTSFTITYDATAPAAPTLTSPANNAVVNGASVTQAWTGVSGVDHYIYESYNDAGANSLRWHETFTATSKTATNVANATYWWRVKAVDAAGNESAWSPLWKLTIDSTAPTVPVISNPLDGAFFTTQPILNKWSAATDNNGVAGYQVAYRYDDGHTFGSSTCPGLTIGGLAVSGCRDTTATQRNHAPATNEQGGVTIWVRAVDAAGNYSAWSTPVHYTYDATAPTVDIPTYTTLGGAITPQVNASDSNSPLSYSWTQLSGPTTGVSIANPSAANPGITVTETGSYVFQLVVKDPAGNQTVRTFSFDYTAPAPSATTPLAAVAPVVTQVSQTPATGDGFTNVAVATPETTSDSPSDNDTGVQGASDVKSTNVLGATATPTTSGFALAWYWWLAIVAAVVAAGWWFIAAARRRRDGDDA